MAIKPILFNTDMVRSIQLGVKTVTRRIIKNKDIINAWDCESDGTPIAYIDQSTGDSYSPTMPCQYQPGDILYVRETWAPVEGGGYIYKAGFGSDIPLWRPSIHMPREAARLFLRVTDVRAEQLYDITKAQAKAEGFQSRDAFLRAFFSMYPSCTVKSWVWVIEFERCEKPEEDI